MGRLGLLIYASFSSHSYICHPSSHLHLREERDHTLHSATILLFLHPTTLASAHLVATTSDRFPRTFQPVRCILDRLRTPLSPGFRTGRLVDGQKRSGTAAECTSTRQLLLMSPRQTAEQPPFVRYIRQDQKGNILDLASAGGGRLRV